MTQESNTWVSTKERLPVESDADNNGYVLAYLQHGQNGWHIHQKGFLKWKNVKKNRHSHWMKIPSPPR